MQHKDKILNFGGRGPNIPEGAFAFTTIEAFIERNAQTTYGIRDNVVIHYEVLVPNNDGQIQVVKHREKYLASNYETARFNIITQALTGKTVGNSFDVDNLVGISGVALFEHRASKNGNIYANIAEIISVDKFETEGQI